MERVVVGEADARDDVPVRAAGRQCERRARRVAVQALPRIERVEQREEIVLVGAAAVQQDESALRLADRRALQRRQAHVRVQLSRGAGSGVSSGSTCVRRCSKSGGRISFSPRRSMSSSVPKPGPSVAISKRTPLGSRK